jgi:NADH-quinone oxidoreductase subunit G
LQDLAVGYGASGSRYEEDKRVVANKNLGPLISTDMTRCIHCTRCVRFGQEIAGIMELGMIGRGEHSEIITFVGKTVDSELSGNAIDLCPVGALTSKPFRYSARTWELVRRPSVSPHCGLGSNLTVQVKQNRVMRVLPRDNESINECWLSDKDRFAYEGLNSEHRLVRPMLKRDGAWQEVDWKVALDFVAAELKRIRDTHGAAAIGSLATPHQTAEELYLLSKLTRGLGSGNVDFRLRQSDFSADDRLAGVPWLGMKIADLSALDRVLVVGSTLRKDHPLIAQRLRQAAKRKAEINLINPVADDLLMRTAHQAIVAPAAMANTLAQVVKAAAQAKGVAVPVAISQAIANVDVSEKAAQIAQSLASGARAGILLGNLAQHHPSATQLQVLAAALGEILGARFGFLGEAANSVGGYLAGAVPFAEPKGRNARAMLETPLKAYILLGVEADLDTYDPQQALAALKQAELVVAMSPYQHGAVDYAHVMLPISPFTETAGTFVNTEGTVQSFQGVVQPLGETRPAWKVLRVLANLLGVPGFDYESVEAVRRDVLAHPDIESNLGNGLKAGAFSLPEASQSGATERIGEVPIYHADAIVRRARSLLATRDGAAPVATLNSAYADKLGLRDGDLLRVRQGAGEAVLPFAIDDKLPAGCIRVPAARAETKGLGAMFGPVTAERFAQQQKVAV